jgi:hypothetical protein
MANSDFNLDMDNYLRRIRKKRTDPIDYSSGKAKVSVDSAEDVQNLPDDEIIIEEREFNGIKKFFLQIFRKRQVGGKYEVEEYEEEIPVVEAEELISKVDEEFDEEFEELNEERRSLFNILFSWLKPRTLEYEEDFDEETVEKEIASKNSEVLKDAKGVMKSVNYWLNQLDAQKKKEFKNSDDFITYTEFLKKYRLIKE